MLSPCRCQRETSNLQGAYGLRAKQYNNHILEANDMLVLCLVSSILFELFTVTLQGRDYIIPILQMQKLRPREIK